MARQPSIQSHYQAGWRGVCPGSGSSTRRCAAGSGCASHETPGQLCWEPGTGQLATSLTRGKSGLKSEQLEPVKEAS